MSLRLSSIYISAGGLSRYAIALVTAPLLIRLLGVQDFGIWTLISSVIGFVGMLELGINAALTNRLASEHARQHWTAAGKTIGTSLLMTTFLGLVATVGCWLAAPYVCNWLFTEPQHRVEGLRGLRVLSLILLPRFWQQWAGGAHAAILRFDAQTAIETPSSALIQVGSVLVVAAGGRVPALGAWWVFITAMTCLAHYVVLRRFWSRCGIEYGFSWLQMHGLLRFSLMQWLISVGQTLSSTVDRLIVGAMLGPAAAGLYGAAMSVAGKLGEFCQLPLRVLPAPISAAWALGDRVRVNRIFLQGTRVNALVLVAIASVLLFWAEPLAKLLVGSALGGQTAGLIRVLAVTSGLSILSQSAAATALGIGRPGISAKWSIVAGIMTCTLIAALSPRYGVEGAAWANIGYWANLVICLEIVRKLGIRPAEYASVAGPGVLGFFFCWAISSSALYQSLGLVSRASVYLVLASALVVWIAGHELTLTLTDRCFTRLRTFVRDARAEQSV